MGYTYEQFRKALQKLGFVLVRMPPKFGALRSANLAGNSSNLVPVVA